MTRPRILGFTALIMAMGGCHTSPHTSTTTINEIENPPYPPSSDSLQQVGDRVFFAFDKSDISSDAQAILSRQADFTKKYGQLTFTIEGHCDERGTREYNLALGERRAVAAQNALVALGVDARRLRTVSYGKERPAVEGHNDAAWAQNRRVVTIVNQ